MWMPFLLFFLSDTLHAVPLDGLEIYYECPLAVAQDVICLARTADLILLNGKERLIVGRQGQGPGEFERIEAVSWSPIDQGFIVYDAGRKRLSLWSKNGIVQKEKPMNYLGDPRTEPVFFSMAAGLAVASSRRTLEILDLVEMGSRPIAPLPEKKDHQSAELTVDGRPLNVYYRWDPAFLLRQGYGLAAVAHNFGNTVLVTDSLGSRARKITVRLPSVLVVDEDVERAKSTFRELFQTDRINIEAPRFWPAIGEMIIDEKRQIWIFGHRIEGAFPFRVFDREGKMVAKGNAPFVPRTIFQGRGFYFESSDKTLVLKQAKVPASHRQP